MSLVCGISHMALGVRRDASAQVGFSFESKKSGGAALIPMSDADRHSCEAIREMRQYAKQHYGSWYHFATVTHNQSRVRMEDIILVGACDLCAGWALAASYNADISTGFSLNVSTSVASAQLSWTGKWESSGHWHTRSGPDRPPEAGATPPQTTRDRTARDQCIFIQGVKIHTRARWLKLRKLLTGKAAVELRDLEPTSNQHPGSNVGGTAQNSSGDHFDLSAEDVPEDSSESSVELENIQDQPIVSYRCFLSGDLTDVQHHR